MVLAPAAVSSLASPTRPECAVTPSTPAALAAAAKRRPMDWPFNPRKTSAVKLAFVREFRVDHNGTQAALRAGYAKSGAHVQASRLIRNDKVAAAIDADRGRESGRSDSRPCRYHP